MHAVLPDAQDGFEVFDLKTGAVLTSHNAGQQFAAMSVVKLLIALDALARNNYETPDGATQQEIHQMLADSDDEIASLPALNAIADTVGGPLIGKLIPKLAPGGTLGSVLGKPKAAEGRDIRDEAVLSHPDASLLRKLAEAVRSRALVIPVAREFSLRDAGEAQTLSERGSINGKIVLVP